MKTLKYVTAYPCWNLLPSLEGPQSSGLVSLFPLLPLQPQQEMPWSHLLNQHWIVLPQVHLLDLWQKLNKQKVSERVHDVYFISSDARRNYITVHFTASLLCIISTNTKCYDQYIHIQSLTSWRLQLLICDSSLVWLQSTGTAFLSLPQPTYTKAWFHMAISTDSSHNHWQVVFLHLDSLLYAQDYGTHADGKDSACFLTWMPQRFHYIHSWNKAFLTTSLLKLGGGQWKKIHGHTNCY